MNQHFEKIMGLAKATPEWQQMVNTVEDSPWHREANVAVHTEMCIDFYIKNIAVNRTEKQNMITLLSLLFHDFGKPETEETLEKKEHPGVFFRRYARHEKVSANIFINVILDYPEILDEILAANVNWDDIRAIKWMVEHHLPYGLKNKQKRELMKKTLVCTLGENQQCFYDQLISDANGRISDDHAQKLKDVDNWVTEFKEVPLIDHPGKYAVDPAPMVFMLVGCSGAGKSTWVAHMLYKNPELLVVSEDDWRIKYALANMVDNGEKLEGISEAGYYQRAWEFCHLNKNSGYEKYAQQEFKMVMDQNKSFILDRTNQSRKNRGKFINVARDKGFKITSIEFYVSETELNKRQQTREDKLISPQRIHQMVMNMETPWYGTEVSAYEVIA